MGKYTYTNETVADISHASGTGLSPQLPDGKTMENVVPGPVGATPPLPYMHEKAHASLAKQRTVLHRFGNK